MNSDLQKERDNASFDVEELTNWYYGGAEQVIEKKFIGMICRNLLKLEKFKNIFQKTIFSMILKIRTTWI